MIKPDILVKSKRRTLSLMVDENAKVIVKAPKNMPFNDIQNFLDSKEKWIKEKVKKQQNTLNINKKIIEYKQVLFLGNLYDVILVDGISDIIIEDSYFCIPTKYSNSIQKQIKKWLIIQAEEIVLSRLEYLAGVMQIDFTSVKLAGYTARWGSCDVNYNLSFNFKIAMLPTKVIDYVVIHELTHILEFNHSQKFWDIVESIMPEYKKYRQMLKKSNFLLKIFTKKKIKKYKTNI